MDIQHDPTPMQEADAPVSVLPRECLWSIDAGGVAMKRTYKSSGYETYWKWHMADPLNPDREIQIVHYIAACCVGTYVPHGRIRCKWERPVSPLSEEGWWEFQYEDQDNDPNTTRPYTFGQPESIHRNRLIRFRVGNMPVHFEAHQNVDTILGISGRRCDLLEGVEVDVRVEWTTYRTPDGEGVRVAHLVDRDRCQPYGLVTELLDRARTMIETLVLSGLLKKDDTTAAKHPSTALDCNKQRAF